MDMAYGYAASYPGGYDEAKLQDWAKKARDHLKAPKVTLGLVFLSPQLAPHAETILEILRVHAQIPILAGCTGISLIARDEEIEDATGLVLALYNLPGAEVRTCHFTQRQIEDSNGPAYWHHETGVTPEQNNGWLVFVDPFRLDCEEWINQWNQAYPGQCAFGGLASGNPQEESTAVFLNGEVFTEGGIGISLGGRVEITGLVSQGCTPIGETWTITKAERNFIQEIGNRAAYHVLAETYNQLAEDDQQKARGNLFVGLVVNEYLEDFHRGDFLIRNLLGADPSSGSLAVGALPRLGQTMQFQRRDAGAASEDLVALLRQFQQRLAGQKIYGACLCSCNGRGRQLFGYPHHDARLVYQHLGLPGVAGFFCNGEIGPVGKRNFLHGYTASLALFVDKPIS